MLANTSINLMVNIVKQVKGKIEITYIAREKNYEFKDINIIAFS